jgi:hypothetical protein
LRQSHLQRIALFTARNRPQIFFVLHHAREETVLPDAAGLPQFAMEILGIDLIGKPDAAGQSGLWQGEQEV